MGTKRAQLLGAFLIVLASLLSRSSPLSVAYAQTATSTASEVSAYKQQLQDQLNSINAQIAQQQQIVTQEETKSVSLQSALEILKAQIAAAQLAIEARDLTIQELNDGIAQKESTINGLNTQLSAEKDSLAGILRETDQLESSSLVVALLSSQSLSDFFSDLDTFNEINAQMQASFAQISSTTVVTQAQETDLQTQLAEESQLLQVQQLQQQQVEAQQTQEKQLLSETKGQEAAYQALITANQKSAAQIRAELFQLNGSAAISFGNALTYANLASQKTGIRPAFLLGIITEESDLGQNVGTGTYTADMAPAQIPIFLAITQSLGLDPSEMSVSAKEWYGWGGAMGPAQFIPSTWALYAGYPKPSYTYTESSDRIGPLTGDTPPNPWVPQDAFMASALYLTDDDAAAQTPVAEFRAAMCYLAGCGNVGDVSLQFYANAVLCYELQYQENIDTITGGNGAAAMKADARYYGQC